MKIAIRVLRNKTKQMKRLYCTRFKHTRIKQSGFTLPRQTRLNKVAVHFLGIYTIKQSDCTHLSIPARSELNIRTLSRRLAVYACHFSLTNISKNAGDAPLARVNA